MSDIEICILNEVEIEAEARRVLPLLHSDGYVSNGVCSAKGWVRAFTLGGIYGSLAEMVSVLDEYAGTESEWLLLTIGSAYGCEGQLGYRMRPSNAAFAKLPRDLFFYNFVFYNSDLSLIMTALQADFMTVAGPRLFVEYLLEDDLVGAKKDFYVYTKFCLNTVFGKTIEELWFD